MLSCQSIPANHYLLLVGASHAHYCFAALATPLTEGLMERDYFMSAEEALELGIVDHVLQPGHSPRDHQSPEN